MDSVDSCPVRGLRCMEIWGGSHAADASLSTPGLDLWVYSSPYENAADGGDVHYLSLCGGGFITRFILADVSGHGASVAEMAHSLRDLMRDNINRKNQERLVNELNRQFTELARMQRFATALVGTYLTTGDRLTITNAGHPRPLWYSTATGQWSILDNPDSDRTPLANLPLGVDETISFSQSELVLGRGDLVFCYTDALTEATNPAGRALGEAGLLAVVRGLEVSSPATMAAALVEQIHDYRGGKPAEDDLTFLVLHHNGGSPPRQSLRQKFDVFAKVLGFRPV